MAQLFNVIGFRLETSDWIDFNEERERERRICDFVTTDCRDCPERKISATSREDQQKIHHGRIELDSHANTIVFGKKGRSAGRSYCNGRTKALCGSRSKI